MLILFPIPKIHKEILITELNRLINIGVLKHKNNSKWAAPTFIIPKKNGTVWFISGFRELNKRIKRKTFPILNIQDLLFQLKDLKYATSLNEHGILSHQIMPFLKKAMHNIAP